MKKNYMAPDMVIESVKIDNILLGTSDSEADPGYEGGGDAKAFDFNEDLENILVLDLI